jgi:predicted P-loop ATPase
MPKHAPIDYAGLAAALLREADSLVSRWLPAGVERNGRWYVGDFDGAAGESANVNLKTGQWIDNAAPDQDKGGDLISLYARIHNLNNASAARELMRDRGWGPAPAPASPRPKAASTAEPAADPEPQPEKRKSQWRPIVPVPEHAPQPRFRFGYRDRQAKQWVEHDAVRTWEYRFEGQRYGYVARFERTSSEGELVKETVPLTWCVNESDDRGHQRWHWKTWDAPRPLYVPATVLSADRARPVVLVEGEKCAQAGHDLLGAEFDFVTWPGGCKTVHMAAWSWLAGRTVYLWPDCDAQRERLTRSEREANIDPATKPLLPAHRQPGMQAMVDAGSRLAADHACTVLLCPIPAPGSVGAGWDIADAIEQGWTADQVRAFIQRAQAFVPPNDATRARAAPVPDTETPDPQAWRIKLLENKDGVIRPVRENVVLALDGMTLPDGRRLPGVREAEGVIAFNEFTNNVDKLRPTPWGTPAGPWDEVDELLMGEWLVREHQLPSVPRGTLEEAVLMVAKRHAYHPVRQQLVALRGKWDGEKRLATWIRRCCMEEDEYDAADPLQQYLARVGTWVVMALCARVLTPGCKFDYMVIFEGSQGVGKSTLARVLGGEHYADTGLVMGDKDSFQNLQGVTVYEMGELDALNRSEITRIKQFISSQEDRFRASFDRRPKDYPRQVVFIGTTNEDHYLIDPTGNRRFWPVQVSRQIDLAWLQQHREQMFAEALVYLDAGNRFHPTPKEQRELFNPQQQQRTVENAIESAIGNYLYPTGTVGGPRSEGHTLQECTLVELLAKVGIGIEKLGPGRYHEKQAAAALRKLGWTEHKSSRPGRPRVYRRPPPTRDIPATEPAPAHITEDADACPV